MATRVNHKLSFRFFGPFKVLQKIGAVAYRLDLPADCKIHPVVHVSQLKKHVSPHIQVSTEIPAIPSDSAVEAQLVAVVDKRSVQQGASFITKLRVRWEGLLPAMDTWEEVQDIRRRFPQAPVSGQPGFQGGKSVTPLRKHTGGSG